MKPGVTFFHPDVKRDKFALKWFEENKKAVGFTILNE